MIRVGDAEEALEYLAMTDASEAKLKALVLQKKRMVERAEAAVILFTEGTGPIKQATAKTNETVQTADAEYFQAIANHETCKNKRATASEKIQVWRSISSAKNHGQIV